jgi:DNA primase
LPAVALYTNDSRDRVREAVDFVELVSARTDLRRAGPTRYEGLCPFHDERTPSFGIDPVQKVYYCFGCQASGDLFTFVQETEGVDFKGALELLAERYGVELQREQEDPKEAAHRARRQRLLELLDRTTTYYERCLWDSKEAEHAREYLADRGLGEEILREFRVGYAPSAWDRVLLASRRGGFSEEELYATGLVQRSRENGRPYDRFRARIMFPLADVRGRVLGFGARALAHEPGATDTGEEGGRSSGPPKYLNTADNDVYHKGMHLFGANLARAHAARAGEAILCEGYTDTIALHQAGMRNAVGLMGTALTADQVGELARMAQTVLLALDADSAGQEAMLRASTLAARRNLELRVVPLAGGKDPAEMIQQEGVEAITAAVAQSVPFVRFRVELILSGGDRSSPEGRDRMIGALRPVFATLPPSVMRMELTRMVSSRLELSEGLAEKLLESGGKPVPPHRSGHDRGEPRAPTRGSDTPGPAGGEMGRREDTERAFLALCVAAPEEGERALAGLDVEEHFSSELLRRAARHLREGGLRAPLQITCAEEQSPEDRQLQTLMAELVVQAGREEADTPMLEVQRLQLELARVDRQIARARGQERGDVSELAHRRAEVKREFDRAYGRVLERTGGG